MSEIPKDTGIGMTPESLEQKLADYFVIECIDFAPFIAAWKADRARIEALENQKGLTIPKNEWSICVPHNRAYWTAEGCLQCRIEALENDLHLMTAERDALGSELLGRTGQCDASDL